MGYQFMIHEFSLFRSVKRASANVDIHQNNHDTIGVVLVILSIPSAVTDIAFTAFFIAFQGMVVIDREGNMAAGTSTNGANHKIPGWVLIEPADQHRKEQLRNCRTPVIMLALLSAQSRRRLACGGSRSLRRQRRRWSSCHGGRWHHDAVPAKVGPIQGRGVVIVEGKHFEALLYGEASSGLKFDNFHSDFTSKWARHMPILPHPFFFEKE